MDVVFAANKYSLHGGRSLDCHLGGFRTKGDEVVVLQEFAALPQNVALRLELFGHCMSVKKFVVWYRLSRKRTGHWNRL